MTAQLKRNTTIKEIQFDNGMNLNMIVKKYILTTLFTMIGFFGVFATPQIHDELIYNGDTLLVYLYLPDEFYKADTISLGQFESIYTVNLFGNKKTCWTTNCGREYQAAWEIIENQLYLTGIYSCCYYEDSIKADLTLLFKDEKIINGKVKADWVNSKSIGQGGKILFWINFQTSLFEKEYEFEFSEGQLLNIKTFDNSKSRWSEYSQDVGKFYLH